MLLVAHMDCQTGPNALLVVLLGIYHWLLLIREQTLNCTDSGGQCGSQLTDTHLLVYPALKQSVRLNSLSFFVESKPLYPSK